MGMGKRIGGIFRQRCRNKVADALAEKANVLRGGVNLRCNNQGSYLNTSRSPIFFLITAIMRKGFEADKRTVPFLLSLIVSIFIVLLNITGCSDNPYTGSMLQPGDVDNYIFSPGGGRICLTNGIETACVTLVPKRRDGTLPLIYIYSSSIAYVYYHEDMPIIRAERETDTSGIIKEITGGTGTQSGGGTGSGVVPRDDGGQQPGGGNNNGGDSNNGGGNNNNGDDSNNGSGNNNGGNNNGNGGNNNGGGSNNGGGNNNGGSGVGPRDGGGTPPGDGNNENGGTTPTGGTPPNDDSPPNNIVSHYVFSNPPNNLRGDEWIVWIYYPDDYSGPRGVPNSPEGFGFTITVDGGETTEFAQVTGGELGSGVRLVIRTDQLETNITIRWNPPYTDRSATITLKSDIDLRDYDL